MGRCKHRAWLWQGVHGPHAADEMACLQAPLLRPPFVLLGNEIRLMSRFLLFL